ncbi:MAG: pyridoxal phosphate-dependent aminotransferase [Hyphomicrobiaceae bacterium]
MAQQNWAGRFPPNDIITLLDVNRRFNLAESTAQDLTFGELIELAGGISTVSDLKLGYGSSAGLLRLRQAIAKQSDIAADEVIATQGTALGLFLLAFELARPGDEVVITTPCFPPSRDTLVGTGVTLREARLSFDDGYRVTASAIEPHLSDKTRLVSLASPQNPNGVCTSIGEITAVLEIMRRKSPRAYLFVDETYRDASYGNAAPLPSAANLDARVITGASVSKAHGAPGLRTGWLTVRDPELRQRLIVAKMNLVISGSPLDETLAAAILEKRESILAPRRKLLSEGVAITADWVEREARYVEWVKPGAGALCCIRLRTTVFDAAGVNRFWALLPQAELQLGGGTWFGETSSVFRLGFGYLPIKELPKALDALSSVLVESAR